MRRLSVAFIALLMLALMPGVSFGQTMGNDNGSNSQSTNNSGQPGGAASNTSNIANSGSLANGTAARDNRVDNATATLSMLDQVEAPHGICYTSPTLGTKFTTIWYRADLIALLSNGAAVLANTSWDCGNTSGGTGSMLNSFNPNFPIMNGGIAFVPGAPVLLPSTNIGMTGGTTVGSTIGTTGTVFNGTTINGTTATTTNTTTANGTTMTGTTGTTASGTTTTGTTTSGMTGTTASGTTTSSGSTTGGTSTSGASR